MIWHKKMPICKRCDNELGIRHNTPFKCEVCGGLYFPYQPVRDVIFVYPDPVGDFLFNGIVYIPPIVKANLQAEVEKGTVLAVGKGYWDKKGKFHPVELRVGDRVFFDKTCPWWIDVEASDGKKYLVRIMGARDVKCKIVE